MIGSAMLSISSARRSRSASTRSCSAHLRRSASSGARKDGKEAQSFHFFTFGNACGNSHSLRIEAPRHPHQWSQPSRSQSSAVPSLAMMA